MLYVDGRPVEFTAYTGALSGLILSGKENETMSDTKELDELMTQFYTASFAEGASFCGTPKMREETDAVREQIRALFAAQAAQLAQAQERVAQLEAANRLHPVDEFPPREPDRKEYPRNVSIDVLIETTYDRAIGYYDFEDQLWWPGSADMTGWRYLPAAPEAQE